ncbi:MAG TPA: hypothetical protein VFP53_06665 [Sphingomicrobium sp.]|nr:hypothetical protein [Sphingomicrobium sp.]
MSVRSFHSVFMASAVAGAALGCYLISLRVASERAALESVETEIVLAQREIRLLQTEIGTRGRLSQLERWNTRALLLSAPTADQLLGDKFQLARLVQPERKLELEAPVVLASAPVPEQPRPLDDAQNVQASDGQLGGLVHQASLTVTERIAERPKMDAVPSTELAATDIPTSKKKAGEKRDSAPKSAMTRRVRTAKVDPLAPLPAVVSTGKDAGRTQ